MRARRKVNVTERIRIDIVDGHFQAGDHLSIDRLASRYETSHMPVREALRELAGDGIIVFEPNKGARVRTLNQEFIVDLMDLRASVEANLARRAADRASSEDIEKLTTIQQQLETEIAARRFDHALKANHEFHNAINLIAGNEDAAAMVSRNWLLLATLWRKYGYDEERFQGVVNDHRQIISAFEQNDTRAAEFIMAAHVHKSKLDLVRAMKSSVSKSDPGN